MTSRTLGLLMTVTILLVAAGCVGGRVSVVYYDDDPPPLRVKRVYAPTHYVCGRDCHDCFWDGARVVIVKGHRHHPGCGHAWNGKHWVVIKRGKVKPPHRHTVKKVTKVKPTHPRAVKTVKKAKPPHPHAVKTVKKAKRVP